MSVAPAAGGSAETSWHPPDNASPIRGEAMVLDETRLRRIRWRCRRGMLENDLILARFLASDSASLTEDDIAKLDELLNMTDEALWNLLSGHGVVDPTLAPLVSRLRAA